MTAVTFTLTDLASGTLRGHALLCADARYVSVLGRGTERLDRRFVRPEGWQAIESEIASRLPATPLPHDSAIVQALLSSNRKSLIVQYYTQEPIDATPQGLGERLDTSCVS